MLNHIVLMGRLTADPTVRYTKNQTPVTSFTLAVDDDYVPQGQEKKTIFVDCVAWKHTAEFVSKYFKKGSMAVASGKLQFREWEKDGNKHKVAEVLIENIYFGSSNTSKQKDEDAPSDFQEIDVEDADFPF